MDFNEDYKNKIGKQLTLRLAQGLEEKKVTLEETRTIASFILDNIDTITDDVQLTEFLTKLSEKWPIFSDILTLEKGKTEKKKEEAVVQEASELIKEKKIDEAVNKVKAEIDRDKQGGTQ